MGFINKAIDLATELGSHFHLGMIYDHATIAAFKMNDLELAREFLGCMGKLNLADKRVIESLHYSLWAVYHMSSNSLPEAQRAVEKGLRSALASGACIPEAYGRIVLACVLRKAGKEEDAAAQPHRVETMVRPLGATHCLYLVRLTQASMMFDRETSPRGDVS